MIESRPVPCIHHRLWIDITRIGPNLYHKVVGITGSPHKESIDMHWHHAFTQKGRNRVSSSTTTTGIPQTIIFSRWGRWLGPFLSHPVSGSRKTQLRFNRWKFPLKWQKLKKPTYFLPIESTRQQVHTNSPTKSSLGMIQLLNHLLADLPCYSKTFGLINTGSMLNRAANGHHQPQHHHPCCKPTEHTLDDHDLSGYQGVHS